MQTDLSAMTARLDRLERSNRRLKYAVASCVAALGAAIAIGAAPTPEKVIKAESIQLVDAEGKLRAALGSDKDGTFFFMNDPNGKLRASMAATAAGSYMNLKDAESVTRAIITYDEEGPGLRLRDGNSLAAFAWDKDGPLMHLQRQDGRSRFVTPTTDSVVDPEPPPLDPPATTPQQQRPTGPVGPRR